MDKIVVTGLGLICAIGADADECWKNAVDGVNGIKEVESVNHELCYSHLGGEYTSFKTPEGQDRASALAIKAAGEAINDAKLDVKSEADRVSVILGSCVGGAVTIEKFYRDYLESEAKATGADVLKMPISAIANNVALTYGAGGVIDNVANACAAGTMSIVQASELIRSGKADVVIAGGSDPMSSLAYSGFTALHALDTEPCRPFNKSKGIALGEGAGILIIESYEHAKKRGAKIYCEILGSGVSSDAHHITAPAPDGAGMQSAMERSIANSGINACDVDYVNAHGTGTPLNDSSELGAMLNVFGKEGKTSASSTKSMVGHCLGAAGSVEAVFCVKAIESGVVPPTIGFTEEDKLAMHEKAGDFDFVPNKGKARKVDYVQSNNYAFGGNNASVIYAKEGVQANVRKATDEKVFITGFGIVSPLGNTTEAYVSNVNDNADGVKCEQCGDYASAIGAEDFASVGIKLNFYRKLDKLSQMTCIAGKAALANAGITIDESTAKTVGIVAGTSDGPQTDIANFQKGIIKAGNQAGSAFLFPNTVYNAAPGYLSICAGVKGYNVTYSNGAASGLASVAFGVRALRVTDNNVIMAVGADETSETMHTLYEKLGAFNGKFKLGDGATTIVLEKQSSADERGAKKYAEVLGCGFSHEPIAFGKFASGKTLKKAIDAAIAESGITADEIGLVMTLSDGLDSVAQAEKDALCGFTSNRINVKERTGEGRAASSALAVAHAALALSGEIKAQAAEYALVLGMSAGGSCNALVLRKA